jgi:hypothetical protein
LIRRNIMPRKLAAAMIAAITLIVVSGLHDPASAGTLDGFSAGGGYTHGLGHQSGAPGLSGAASRSGALAHPGGGYAGTGHRYVVGGHQGAGWYQRGFGGNLNPGWGYGFGPQLGGVGH